jgi:hypothetical protein
MRTRSTPLVKDGRVNESLWHPASGRPARRTSDVRAASILLS